jgi:hypothetical protein
MQRLVLPRWVPESCSSRAYAPEPERSPTAHTQFCTYRNGNRISGVGESAMMADMGVNHFSLRNDTRHGDSAESVENRLNRMAVS